MKLFLSLAALTAATPFAATTIATEYLASACIDGDKGGCIEYHAERCDKGNQFSCKRLAYYTLGQCASPAFIGGCRYDSEN